MKKTWSEWAQLFAKKTGKCPGSIPSFGLPTDTLDEQDFKQTLLGLSLHNAESCGCWKEDSKVIDVKTLLSDFREIQSKQMQNSLVSQDSKEVLMELTERNVRERVVQLKQKLTLLIDRISVNNFRFGSDGKVTWDLTVPKSLSDIFGVLKGLEPVKTEPKGIENLVLPYVPLEE